MFKVMSDQGVPDSPTLLELVDRTAMRELMSDFGLPAGLRPIQPTEGERINPSDQQYQTSLSWVSLFH